MITKPKLVNKINNKKNYFFQVYDYDFALRDDFIGEATLSLIQLDLDQDCDVTLTLVETGKFEYLGQVSIGLKLVPKSKNESPTSSVSGICFGDGYHSMNRRSHTHTYIDGSRAIVL